ncbi:beta-hexosaminidase-like isoform X1 [Octopus sinensis]|uniref:beta-N-acetylhexosaminidase n=1 Tax=Octopus sinensis TaxID=2607531 RepID=A0A6P7S5Z3_9MOLL|nr:beta-hexosaminidase-like isoform X1 [Octopus sinensis]
MNFNARILLLATCCANIFPALVAGITQETIDQIATNMDIKHDILSNLDDGLRTFQVQLTITNRGKTAIPKDGWVIYICYIRMIEPNYLPNPKGVVRDGIKITHLQGCTFALEPASTFEAIQPNGVKKIKFLGENWIVSKTDIMPNWYVTAPGLTPRTIVSTVGNSFVGDFDKVEKWKRYDFKENSSELHDKYDPYTTKFRYAINDIKDLGKSPSYVIPTPLEINVDESKTICLGTRDWVVIYPDVLLNEANYLTKKLPVTKTKQKPLNRYIELDIKPVKVTINGKLQEKAEAYTLEVVPGKEYIKITGQDAAGVFYGIQSLMSLTSDNYIIPKSNITDAPRFAYRGMEFDVARNFFGKETVFKLFDMMAIYKLNRFHFHLTDDEGWRLKFEGLEELTKVGGHRCHDLDETNCIMPQLGSGPTTIGSGSGFYTKEDYQEILQYAKERHIQVIPEIDMPGHSHALNKAMQSRYNKLVQNGQMNDAKRYVLVDPDDTSQYKSIQMYTDNAINPCLESTYNFIEKIVKTLIEYHETIMPLQVYHFGGDEVAKGTWQNSTACKKVVHNSSNPHGKELVKEYFVRRLSNITATYGINLAAWEDGVMKSGTEPYNISALKNDKIFAYAWDNVWEWGYSNRAYKLANDGFKIVMSQATHLYFDHPYEPDPEEPGYYWATRFTDTRKTFGFMPENIYGNAKVARSGEPITKEQLCGKEGKTCVKLKKFENLAGMQGHLWSETVRTPERFEFMVFPRLLALSERAWHRAPWELEEDKKKREEMRKQDWERFANTIGYREMKRLDQLGIRYRVPPPGAIYSDDQLTVNVAFPGLTLQYSENGGKTWCDVKSTTKSTTDGEFLLRTR